MHNSKLGKSLWRLRITNVTPGSAADSFGLAADDFIDSVGGTPTTSNEDLSNALSNPAPPQPLVLRVWRLGKGYWDVELKSSKLGILAVADDLIHWQRDAMMEDLKESIYLTTLPTTVRPMKSLGSYCVWRHGISMEKFLDELKREVVLACADAVVNMQLQITPIVGGNGGVVTTDIMITMNGDLAVFTD